MRKLFVSFYMAAAAFTAGAQPAKHVVLISIDGFRPDFYKQDWPTPNLHRLAAEGSFADGVRGVFPSVTYPSHTTLVSGALPIRHGIYYNTPFEPAGATGKWYWEYNLVKVPTLWSAVRAAGLKSAAVSWPVTVGAPIDYNVPEVWTAGNEADRVEPLRRVATPAGLLEELELRATGKLGDESLNSDFLARDENSARMTAYLVKTYKPALVAVHLPVVDHAEHEQGRDGEFVRRAVAGADHSIGAILEAIRQAGIENETTVIVTGDHGFVDIHTAVSPNVWLVRKGLIDPAAKTWKARFHTSGAGAFLMLQDRNDHATLGKVREALAAVPAAQRKLFRIVERPELDAVGADPNVALALAPIQGISMNAATTGEPLKPASGGTHGYFPDFKEIQTGFIACGAGIAKGGVVPLMGLEDVAPLISKLLGLNFDAPDGSLYPGLIRNTPAVVEHVK